MYLFETYEESHQNEGTVLTFGGTRCGKIAENKRRKHSQQVVVPELQNGRNVEDRLAHKNPEGRVFEKSGGKFECRLWNKFGKNKNCQLIGQAYDTAKKIEEQTITLKAGKVQGIRRKKNRIFEGSGRTERLSKKEIDSRQNEGKEEKNGRGKKVNE